MKILVTGAKGFIGKNLIAELKNRKYDEIYEYDIDTDKSLLNAYTKDCDFVFHLAGINRPINDKEYMEGNYGFTTELLSMLKEHSNRSPVLVTSSIQAALDNPYGVSKKAAEDILFSYEEKTGSKALVYRLPNVFGKWCRPNYNSAVATFCYNIANDLEIKVNDPEIIMNLVYIDDIMEEFFQALSGKENKTDRFCTVKTVYSVKLGKIAELIRVFKECRANLNVPEIDDDFAKKLYSTYLSYLPAKDFSKPVITHSDIRGSFSELLHFGGKGQVSINISKPGIIKGNHWHHTKNEKFIVISGIGIIRFRKVGESDIIEYQVSGDKMEVVDIPPGYTHCIINTGKTDMYTVMWANEEFDSQHPDTYYEEV